MDLSSATEWGSINDSEIDLLLRERERREGAEEAVQVASSQPESLEATQADESGVQNSDDWGSMNDGEFISFVNKLSQSRGLKQPLITSQPVSDHADQGGSDQNIMSSNRASESFRSNSPLNDQDLQLSVDPAEVDQGSQEIEFGDFDTYFRHKALKQQEEDLQYVEFIKNARGLEYPPVFEGCVIYINGKTSPDAEQLHKLIILHGGTYIQALGAKGNATHIISETLTPQKKLEFRNYKVLKPTWITESIESKRLLHWADYMVIHNDYGQQRIDTAAKPVVEEEAEISQLSQITDPEDNLDKQEEVEMPDHMNCKHPNFLSNFFAKSRLHHLSSWKADLRSHFLHRAIDTLTSRKLEKVATSTRVILHVDFDCFFATVSALMHDPPIDINSVPVCVTHGGNTSDIASCNYVARAKGCRNGMWLRSARRLCPELVCLEYQFDEYERISKLFYEILLGFEIDSILPVSVDEALLDITSLSVTKSPAEIMTEIKQEVQKLTKCSVSCGSGPNVLLAKLALHRAKPNGMYYVHDDEVLTFLDTVRFADLPGIGPQICSKLETELNITNAWVTELRSVSKQKLSSVFGPKTGVTIFNYVRGIDDTTIDILANPEEYERKSLSIDVNWGIRFDTDVEVEKFLGDLAKEMNTRLLKVNMVGSSITLKLATRHPDAPVDPPKYLGMGHCEFVSRTTRFGHFTREAGILATELKHIYRAINPDVKELRGVSISMNKLVSDQKKTQKGLDADQKQLPFKSGLFKLDKPESLKPATKPKSPVRRNEGTFGIRESEINWEVFNELPSQIQKELKEELGRRNLGITGSLYESPKKRKVDFFSNFVSPKKKRPPERTLLDSNYIETRTPVSFQKTPITDFMGIMAKLGTWFDHSIQARGPHEKDLVLFNEFMFGLLEIDEMLKFHSIVRLFEEKLIMHKTATGYHEWSRLVNELRTIFNEVKYEDLEFGF
ncbi:hypothetical protein OGAPHI_002845 [Ogataea philodendri]|uniref:DNA repair protein REV1 n=1 Tax=Ogataea philodendri TaxID=1378263 RepID=A0A9P8P8R8_9ASCO|nr:uncharacterized protein OGAPHI_002845 [Ogataea philodendri]KAH3667196.1 hypothetical protein OGAPHI_002845 [Ogataea philodendri]